MTPVGVPDPAPATANTAVTKRCTADSRTFLAAPGTVGMTPMVSSVTNAALTLTRPGMKTLMIPTTGVRSTSEETRATLLIAVNQVDEVGIPDDRLNGVVATLAD